MRRVTTVGAEIGKEVVIVLINVSFTDKMVNSFGPDVTINRLDVEIEETTPLLAGVVVWSDIAAERPEVSNLIL